MQCGGADCGLCLSGGSLGSLLSPGSTSDPARDNAPPLLLDCRDNFPVPSADVLVVRCGPSPMMKAMEACLDNIGYTREVQFQF